MQRGREREPSACARAHTYRQTHIHTCTHMHTHVPFSIFPDMKAFPPAIPSPNLQAMKGVCCQAGVRLSRMHTHASKPTSTSIAWPHLQEAPGDGEGPEGHLERFKPFWILQLALLVQREEVEEGPCVASASVWPGPSQACKKRWRLRTDSALYF